MLLLTPIIAGINQKRRQLWAWRVWWHALALVTQEITCHWAYIAKLSPLLWQKWFHFPPKSLESCYNVQLMLTWGPLLSGRHPFNPLYILWLCCCAGLCSLIARFMGPTWGPSGADRTQVGPMVAPWTLLPWLYQYLCLIYHIYDVYFICIFFTYFWMDIKCCLHLQVNILVKQDSEWQFW